MESSSLKRLGIRSLAITSSAAMVVGLSATGASAATPNAAPDMDAPKLVSYSVDETEFNLSRGDATFTVTARITDETGLDRTSGLFNPADPVITVSSNESDQSHGFGSMDLVSGDTTDGVYERTVTIPQGSAWGTWDVTIYPLSDELGNTSGLDDFEFFGTLDVITTKYDQEITPEAPEFLDEDGTEKDAVVIPGAEGVAYQLNGETVEPGRHDSSGTVVVASTALEDYFFAESATTEWTYEFDATALAVPEAVTFLDWSGTENDTYTVPDVEGVTYFVNDDEVEAGTHAGVGTVTVNARANEGYRFGSETISQWAHEFNAEEVFVDSSVPVVTGEATVTETLTAEAGEWGPEGVELSYQWSANGEPIEDATGNTLELTAAQLGQAITVTVTGFLEGYESDSVTSEATGAVAAADLTPVNPTVIGETTVGETLTAEAGDWGPEGVELIYQWSANGEPIEGATESTLVLTEAFIGQKISVTVTGSLEGYNDVSLTSAVTADVTEVTPIEFSDVSEGAWFFAQVSWMVENEITTGYTDGTFRPYNPVTRGEAVTFLFRYAADEDYTAPADSGLTDVPPTHNFFEAISWATENGVVNGYTDDTFRSGQNMTRGQVAAILFRQADPEHTAPAESPFTDLTPKSNQYEAITWLAENDITTGRTDGTFDPYANVTRAELATFLQRFDTVVTK